MDSAATAMQVKTKGQTSTGNHQVAATQATMALANTPPIAPSQVFLGDTRGASGTRPNHRPAKNAPVSAAHTSASVNSTQCVLCVANVTYTSASQQGTSDNRPASVAVTGVTRVGARQSHRNAANHQTMAIVSDDAHESRRRGVQVEARDQRQRNDDREHRASAGAARADEACPLPRADQHQHREQPDGGNRRQAEHDAEHHGDQDERGEDAFLKHAAWPRAPARGSGRNVVHGRQTRRSRHRDARRRNPATTPRRHTTRCTRDSTAGNC